MADSELDGLLSGLLGLEGGGAILGCFFPSRGASGSVVATGAIPGSCCMSGVFPKVTFSVLLGANSGPPLQTPYQPQVTVLDGSHGT